MNWISRTHRSVIRSARNQRKQRQFAILLAVIAVVISLLQYYKGDSILWLVLTLPSLAATWFASVIWYPVLILWFWIGKIFGEISATVVLGTIYFILFFPITFVRRIIGKKEVLAWKHEFSSIDFKKQY